MEDKVLNLVSEVTKVGEFINSFPGNIRIISHYDADGICSAAIMVKALARKGKAFHLSFIRQLLSDEIKALSSEENDLIIFLDLGSGQLESIQKNLLRKDIKIIIADHHQIQGEILPENQERVFHINPINFGIDENISGSGVSYLIARAMDHNNKDLSELGIVGAIGDSQLGSIEANWGLSGLNREILKDAEEMKKIRVDSGLRIWGRYTRPIHKALEYSIDPYIPGISESESASVQFLQEMGIRVKNDNGEWRTLADLSLDEQKKLASEIIKERIRGGEENPDWIFGDVYELLDKQFEFRDANEFATVLNATGKLKSAYLGVALCLNDPDSFSAVREIFESYRREIGKSVGWVYKQLENKDIIKKTEHANYVLAGEKISEHVISNIASILERSNIVDEQKPIFAFADTEDGKVKVSARASDFLVKKGLSLKDVLVQAIKDMGGESGGHHGAAGAVIDKESEERLINNIENILKKQNLTEKLGDVANGKSK